MVSPQVVLVILLTFALFPDRALVRCRLALLALITSHQLESHNDPARTPAPPDHFPHGLTASRPPMLLSPPLKCYHIASEFCRCSRQAFYPIPQLS